MPSFTTRVMLRNPEGSEYDDLHEEMEKRGFSRTIAGSDGTSYELPQAEYDYTGNVTRTQVLDKAKAAAAAAAPSRRRAILVTQSAGRAWIGLDEV